ncbi:MAG: PVC-type heme-binding CxxCH protein [Chitinophagaceae bacterium]
MQHKKTGKVVTVSDVSTEVSDKFKEHVRTTEWQSPDQQRLGFKLPPGFEVTCFASEPDITKPINMAFDAKGRLWVTQSSEYPIAAGGPAGKDRITILEDKDGDGKADKFTDFANDLNIPIAIMPVKDGAIAFSIPNIYRFADNDNNGLAEKKEVLLGEFGHQDTHGMINNFIRGFDGWMYSSHGFTNTSAIAGKDGDSVKMVSGNTFRFRLDGSRAEIHTTGRVNPFGFAFDDYGYLYSSDCHTLPIYQLIWGADYPHFGKKERGIGFGPAMMDYQLNSTALSGLVLYKHNQFPVTYRDNFYSGDVVTCRISRSSMQFVGSTPKATRHEDFLVSEDPWFRPVDIKIGPDGSMYIADFYNRIIGHYEVPLNHPGRDRISGRIWKITYKGNKNTKDRLPITDWSTLKLNQLIAGMKNEVLPFRMMAADQIVDRFGEKAIAAVQAAMQKKDIGSNEMVNGLWVLYRLKALTKNQLLKAAGHADPLVQVHAYKILSNNKSLDDALRTSAIGALSHKDPHVQRAAAEVLGFHPSRAAFDPLFSLLKKIPDYDTHLRYTVMLSMRSHMRKDALMRELVTAKFDSSEMPLLAGIAIDVPTAYGAGFLLEYLKRYDQPKDRTISYLQHIAGNIDMPKLDAVILFIKEKFAGDMEQQYMLAGTVNAGIEQRGAEVTRGMRQWAIELAGHFLKDLPDSVNSWRNLPLPETARPLNPWVVINQQASGKFPAAAMLSSGPRGADQTGFLISPRFIIPSNLKIYVRDNDINGASAKAAVSRNAIRVRLSGTQQIIGEQRATQGNSSYIAEFDLATYQGQQGYLEVIDSFKVDRQSEIAIGLFEPAVIRVPVKGPAQVADQLIFAADIAGRYKLASAEPDLKKILLSAWADNNARAAAGAALMNISPDANAPLLGNIIRDAGVIGDLKEKLALSLGQSSSPEALSSLEQALKNGSSSLMTSISMVLANTPEGSARLIKAIRAGYAPARLLIERSVEERLLKNLQANQRKDYEELISNLTPVNKEKQTLIDSRFAAFNPQGKTPGSGEPLFRQNCGMCHQVNNKGGLIGPQLDGIGNWGRKALTEKILDPNRNISEAFRVYNITMKNGKVLSGLFRREEGELQIYANNTGEEFSVARRNIKERTASRYTLMPDHFGTILTQEDLDALLVYLLSIKK